MKRTIDYSGLLGEENPLERFPSLMEAALDEFAKKRFEEASLNDILRNAQMSKGSLYHHFGDKFGLYVSVIDTIVRKKIAFFTPLLLQYNSEDFFAFFKQLTQATVAFMLKDRRIEGLMQRALEETEDFKVRLYALFPYDFNQSFGPAINAAMQAGQISSRFSPEFVAKLFEVLLYNAPKFVTEGTSAEAIVRMIDNLTDVIKHGVLSDRED